MQPFLQPAGRETLQSFVAERFTGLPFVVVSNREPYIHYLEGDEVRWKRTLGGLVTALDPMMQTLRGSWVAHGSGDADRQTAAENGCLGVPPDDPSYTQHRVWLTKKEEEGYYYGVANQALWPLCHNAYTRPQFFESDWAIYQSVNAKFADQVARIVGNRKAVVFVQDYHFALLPAMVKQRCPRAVCAHFWHIPWPNPEVFTICPWRRQLLEGLLGNDLLGFHLQASCNNFLETVERELEARQDREMIAVVYNDHTTRVRPFPISVDFEAISEQAAAESCLQRMQSVRKELRLDGKFVLLGLDRMDYTKGIPDRLRAVDLVLERRPELVGKLVFIQASVPSRHRIPAYKSLISEVENLAEEINWRHGNGAWKPIVTLDEHLSWETVLALYRLADACVVSSLQDGLNLVAKEFVSARTDERGVLLLSRFAGAAAELPDALPLNPFVHDDFAARIEDAAQMPDDEQRTRMQAMRQQVRENNIYTWTLQILDQLAGLG